MRKSIVVDISEGGEIAFQVLIYGVGPQEVFDDMEPIMKSIAHRRGLGAGMSASAPATISRPFATIRPRMSWDQVQF